MLPEMFKWWILVLALVCLIGQEKASLRWEESLQVRYETRYNAWFGRGRHDRAYQGLLSIAGSCSYFCLVPMPDTAREGAYGEHDVFIGADTVWQVWKNLQTDSLVFVDLSLSGAPTSYADSVHPMTWRLLPARKWLEGMECYQAETFFRGRHYVAWYVPAIPLPQGPWKLGGLPGLIVEAYDVERNLVFQLLSIQGGPSNPRHCVGAGQGIGSYVDYQRYWQNMIRRLRRSMAAQSEAGCLSCRTTSTMKVHTWESIPE